MIRGASLDEMHLIMKEQGSPLYFPSRRCKVRAFAGGGDGSFCMSIQSSVWRTAPLAVALAAALMLGACATDSSAPETTTVTPAPTAAGSTSAAPADAKVEVPLDEAQASARCWMKYDSSKMSLDQKSAAVDKCIDETLRNQRR